MVVKKLNDIVVELNGEYLSIDELMEKAKEFWENYVVTGISPEFDEKLDKQYLDIIRTSQPINDSSLEEMCEKAMSLEDRLNELKEEYKINELEKELKTLQDNIKQGMIDSLQDGETKTSCGSYKLSGSVSKKFDSNLFKKDHPKTYDKYCKETITYRLGKIKSEEGEE